MARHKYGARRTTVDGITFASKREAGRYCELALLQKVGVIEGLTLQPKYKLHAGNGNLIGHYVADFTYTEAGRQVVEDAKGFPTALYKWKRRHFEAEYGVTIQEV